MEFLDVFAAYNSEVLASTQLIEGYFKVEMSEGRRQQTIPRTGSIGASHFSFHGIGCRVSRGQKCIDWDFPIIDGKVGLDPWKLWDWTKSAPVKYGRFSEIEVIKGELANLEARGVLKRRLNSNQYFWT